MGEGTLTAGGMDFDTVNLDKTVLLTAGSLTIKNSQLHANEEIVSPNVVLASTNTQSIRVIKSDPDDLKQLMKVTLEGGTIVTGDIRFTDKEGRTLDSKKAVVCTDSSAKITGSVYGGRLSSIC